MVSACDELGRIGALAIDLAPVFAGEFRAQRPHRLADRRKLGFAGGALAHALISARPLFIATTLRSGTSARKLTTSPSRQISVRMVSPGNTGAENRPANDAHARRIVVADAFQQRMADHAEGAEPVQDRPRKARGLGHLGIGVQRIEVGGQPIDQRLLRPRAEIADQIGRALGHLVHRRALARRPAEAAVGAGERGLRHGRDQRAARLVGDLALGVDQRALAGALVDHLDDAASCRSRCRAACTGACSVKPCSPLTIFTQSMPVSRSRTQKPG